MATVYMKSQSRYRRRPPHGFTLIELLVVVAIIALLVSILLPALQQARDIAKQTTCGVQLRQFAVGTIFYTGDYWGYFPAGGVSGSGGGTLWTYALLPYLSDLERIYLCPTQFSDVQANTYMPNGFYWMFYDGNPVYNGSALGGPGGIGHYAGPTKRDDVNRASQVIMFTEVSGDWWSSQPSRSDLMYATWGNGFVYNDTLPYTTTTRGRHQRRVGSNGLEWGYNNFTMCDGSVRAESMEAMTTVGLNAGFFQQYPIDPVNAVSDPGYIADKPSAGEAADFWFVPWW